MHREMARLTHTGASDAEIAETLHLTAAQLVEEWLKLASSEKAVSREEGVNLILAKLIVEAKEALATKNDELALIIRAPEDSAVITFNMSGIITGISLYGEKLLGFPSSSLIGKPIDLALTGGIRQVEQSAQEMAKAEDGDFVRSKRVHARPDGTAFEAEHSLVAIYGSMGQVTGFVREIRDLTNRRVHEIAIEELNASLALLIQD